MRGIVGQAVGACLAALLPTGAPFARAQTLSHLVPGGVTRGQTTRVTCYGSGLAKADRLWTTFPATIQKSTAAPANDNQVTFDVAAPTDAPIGMFGVRIANDSGLSDLRLFVVDDLPVVTASGQNLSVETAQKVKLPAAVAGVMGAEQRHYFAITVQQNQRVAFEVVAHRFGVDFDPLVQIWSPDHKEVLTHDNDEGIDFDCRFEHTFKQAGEYVVELRDTRFMGGANWTYHLRMGDFPVSRVAFPAGGQRGRWVSIAFPGRTATDLPPIGTTVDPGPLHNLLLIATKGNDGSAWVPFAVDEIEQQLELEPNNDPAQANAFRVPRSINGRLEQKGDVDCFRFQAAKGQSITFRAHTRRLGSPADLYLRLLNSQAATVAEADDSGAQDAQVSFSAPADGTYFLAIEDLNRRGGPEFVYRVEALAGIADFALQPSAEQLVVPKGAAVPLALQASRAGYNGPIAVSAETTGSTLRLTTPSFSVGQTATTATISAPPDSPPGLFTLRLAGTATIGETTVIRGGDLTPLVAPKLNNLRWLPPSVTRDLAVLVVARAPLALKAKLAAPAVARYLTTPVTVSFVPEKYFLADVQVQFENLPPNVTVATRPIPKGQTSAQFVFESKPNTPLGKFAVFVSGSATYQDRTVKVYADILDVEIRPAFSLTTLAKEVRIRRGGTATLAVKVERLPGFVGPINVALENLPKGVSGKPGQIAEKQAETVLELSAAADAATVTVTNVTASGTATIAGQNEKVSVPAVSLVVTEK